MKEKLVLAIGGNAIQKENQKGTVDEQKENINNSSEPILKLVESGYTVVITHGNGPQVGSSLIKEELASDVVPQNPLDVCNAGTQGTIGYLIQQSFYNKMKQKGINKPIVSLVTQVVVDKDDEAFNNPTKPIGPFYTKEKAEKIMNENGLSFVEDSGRGYRRVVPSPMPKRIVEKDSIEALMNSGSLVIAAGGGGIPVIEENGVLTGVEAVVDKDFASALLAAEIKADYFFILTGVEQVAINYGKPNQQNLSELSIEDAMKYMEEGQFPKGSMGPKINAAIYFLENGGKNVIITSIDKLSEALEGKTGTRLFI